MEKYRPSTKLCPGTDRHNTRGGRGSTWRDGRKLVSAARVPPLFHRAGSLKVRLRDSRVRQFTLDLLPLSCCQPSKLAAVLPIVPASRPASRRIEPLPRIRAGNSLDGPRLREIRRHRAGMYRMAFRRLEPKPHPEPQLQPRPDTCAKRELTICPRVRAVCLADAVLCGRPFEAASESTSRGSLTCERST